MDKNIIRDVDEPNNAIALCKVVIYNYVFYWL